MKETINILHLSDLHFGIKPTTNITPTAIARRNDSFDSLLKIMGELEPDWKPDIIVVSGDIGWRGAQRDYIEAKSWLTKLLLSLNLTQNELIVCAGNHDISQVEDGEEVPSRPSEVGYGWIKAHMTNEFFRPFENYDAFCKEMGMPALQLGETNSYLTGIREINGLRFLVFNSEWFCRGDNDMSKLSVGLLMNSLNQLAKKDAVNEEPLTIAVLHHTSERLLHHEMSKEDSRAGAYSYLANHSQMIFSGHAHGTGIEPDRKFEQAYLFIQGAGYQGDNYCNNFGILKVNKADGSLLRRSYEFGPPDEKWMKKKEGS